jgi:hypothetical protein
MLPVSAIVGLVSQIVSVGSELIEDKDKRNEFAFQSQKLSFELLGQLLSTKTIPWVDALVKIILTLKVFIRPVVGAAMTAFGAYAHYKGIQIEPAMHAIFDAAAPAWGISRHQEKKEKVKAAKQVPEQLPESFWDD